MTLAFLNCSTIRSINVRADGLNVLLIIALKYSFSKYLFKCKPTIGTY
jgi:hypothetical protein